MTVLKRLGILLVALLLVGCSSSARPVLPVTTPGAQPPPATQSGSGATTQAPVPTYVHMNSVQEGWALTRPGVVRTADGGNTWIDVTPANFPNPAQAAFFLDTNTGWVAGAPSIGADGKASTPIFRTIDGGRSWQRSVVDGLQFQQITFLDSHRGWMMRSEGVATGGWRFVTLLRTDDAGATWKPIAQDGTPSAPLHNFPRGGMKSGVTFVNDRVGWATGEYTNTSSLFFFQTNDGGATWAARALDIPARLTDHSVYPSTFSTRPPWVFPRGRLVMELNGFCGEAACEVYYHSDDNGKTWHGTAPTAYPVGEHPIATFADPDHGWVSVGTQMRSTTDGGQTWTDLPPLSDVRALDFVTPTIGWAITADRLLRTDDGGRTWASLALTLSPNEVVNGDFTLVVSVARKDVPRSEPIDGAAVRVKTLGLERVTDQRGMAEPLVVALKSKDSFPYQIEVLKKGYKSCTIDFGNMVFPRAGDWWAHDAANPSRLFVYLPDGDGVATGDECYGGRTQPQTPGPSK